MRQQTPPSYSQRNETEFRKRMARELANCHKKNERVILTAPDGSKWALTVDNSGNLSTDAVT